MASFKPDALQKRLSTFVAPRTTNGVCSLPPVRSALSRLTPIALAGLCIVAGACSSPAQTATPTTHPKTTTNTGLCTLVSRTLVATAVNESMYAPTALTQGATTECAYRAESVANATVIIRYDTNSNASEFAKYRATFERHGQKLGPVTGLGDQGYYFTEQVGEMTVSTVVLLKGSLQLLVTGTAAVNPIGSIARFALGEYEAKHSTPAPSG
jgi:hypothetical protein